MDSKADTIKSESVFFSVVIPTFNRAKELARAITSVIAQTFQSWEVIVVDDGSADQTEHLLKQLKNEYEKIRFIKRPANLRKGVSTCRNLGIEHASGKYIAFLDSDDEWLEDRLMKDKNAIESGGFKAVYSGITIKRFDSIYKAPTRHLIKGETYQDLIFSGENFAQTSSLVVNRMSLKAIRFDINLDRHEDMDFFIRIGNIVGWTFLKHHSTIVNWEHPKPLTHFESMKSFYQIHSPAAVNPNNLARYLTWAWVSAARFSPGHRDFFIKELRSLPNLNLKYRAFRLIPVPIFQIWKLLKRVKSGQM